MLDNILVLQQKVFRSQSTFPVIPTEHGPQQMLLCIVLNFTEQGSDQ